MQFNPEVIEILKEFKISKDAGLLYLLAVHFELDIDSIVPKEISSMMNITKIVDKDYNDDSIKWNIPLFAGQDAAFDWVTEWLEPFGRMNSDRKGSPRDAISRMRKFFQKYPEWRKEDVFSARDLYLATIRDPKFLMKSHKFIFDGVGAMQKSTLLEFCEKSRTASVPKNNMKGALIS